MVPLAVVLIPFTLFVAGVLAYGALTMWALYHYGGDYSAFLATFLFWAGCAIVLFFAVITLSEVDWSQPLLQLGAFAPSPF